MWNNDLTYDEKLEKCFDLSPYLSYVQHLFNAPSSDSEPSDNEVQGNNSSTLLVSGQTGNNLVPDLPPSNSSFSDHSSLNSSPGSSSASDFSSDSEFQTKDSSSLASKLKPISDEELQNLLRVHKSWKKSPYTLGSEEDIMSLFNASSSAKRSSSSNNVNTGGTASSTTTGGSFPDSKSTTNKNNRTTTTGGENTTTTTTVSNTPFEPQITSDNKNRSRKQSFKVLRREEVAGVSSSSSSGSSSASSSTISKVILPSTPVVNQSSPSSSLGSAASTSSNIENNAVAPGPLKAIHMEGDIKSEDIKRNSISATAQAANVSVTGAPTNFMDDDDESENSSEEDDNDSLSDYVSMAATVQSVGGQMLSNPNIVSFKNVITSATTSASSSSSSSTTTQGSLSSSKQGTSQSSSKTLFNTGSSSSVSDVPKKKKEKDLKEPKQKKLTPHKQAKLIEVLNMKRRRVYVLLCKKEIGKTQRQRTNNHKEMLVIKRRLTQGCSRQLRQKAIQSQKTMKESVWRAKRLTREMLAYWKQADRVEREVRKRREKEAEEQRKLDVELMEAKRQQRKLNFLITQTELYAHFMSKKLGRNPEADDEIRILSQLSEDKNTRVSRIDNDYDSESMKTKAKMNVEHAFKTQLAQVQLFDLDVAMREDFKSDLKLEGGDEERGELPQPDMFTGLLKHYQLKGMNWLVNLYDQGINGILADEMGLGKTVQSIAFLAFVAERYHVWGPFLIIAPASTLHNWQQEFKRFVPKFKVVPYWGNPQERKILRQFWQQSNVHTEEASFHVVVTSYQIVMTDIKYFNRIKWQYLILDEAQAIKSTASARWKMLLGFSCRNRLLLTGTPIQNTMGELWALLHFIMPSLFDSHEEFNEWFSKDIESHAENKSFIDEKHLSRLHLILKPFMLRRIKKDVENELSDKIEVLVYCPLTSRQRLLYTVLKKKIRIEDLLKSSGPSNSQLAQHATTNLMNLVMQFRKVCNHPDLFERREIQSPFYLSNVTCLYPKLIFRDGILHLSLPSKQHLLENKFSIFNPEHIHRSLASVQGETAEQKILSTSSCEWSFLRLAGIGVGELSNLMYGGLIERWKYLLKLYIQLELIYHRRTWANESEFPDENSRKFLNPCDIIIWPESHTSFLNVKNSTVLKDFVFTSRASSTSSVYTLTDHKIYRIPETLEHRKMRSRKNFPEMADPPLMPEVTSPTGHEHCEVRQCQRTTMPSFLYNMCPKLWGAQRQLYFSDRSAAWWEKEHQMCTSSVGYNLIVHGQPEKCSSYSWKKSKSHFIEDNTGGLSAIEPTHGWSRVVVPDKEKLVTDSGKLGILDNLLQRLKMNGHRVLIYSQMTKMIDILEEYMWHRKWTYMRLDGSSKIAERRDMVADFQSRSDIFVFLLSTRAGGLGINLTAADTVIFYDSDWNPTVDQQAMDRAHRLGQTKQVHVYRLICKGTIEERILQRAREKNEIQRMVISGGNFRTDTLKPKEVVSLLLDDEELEKKYRQKQAERKLVEEVKSPAAEGGKDSKPAAAAATGNLKRKHPKSGVSEKILQSVSSSVEIASNVSSSAAGSVEGSAPGSPSRSDGYQDMVAGEVEIDSEIYQEGMDEEVSSNEGSTSFNEEMDVQLSPSAIEGFNKTIEWNADIHSDGFETDFPVLPKRPKIGRGTGKRGRPPSRVRVQVRETDGDNSVKRGAGSHPIERRRPGRPRLRPVGPANQGVRGRRPGRPPLSRKAESLSSSLTPLTTSQRVFGFYSSPDLDL